MEYNYTMKLKVNIGIVVHTKAIYYYAAHELNDEKKIQKVIK